MEIRLQKVSYALGESIPVEVRYANETAAIVKIDNPRQSTAVYMHAVDVATDEDLAYPMVPEEQLMLDDEEDEFVLSAPPVDQVDIQPGDALTFTTDPNARIYLRPGTFRCFLTEDNNQSNQVEIEIVYTPASVDYMIALVADASVEYGRREWASEWLQALYPSFEVRLSQPTDTDSVKASNEAFNRTRLDKLKRQWAQERNTLDIPARLGN